MGRFRQLPELLLGSRNSDPVASDDQRLRGRVDQVGGLPNLAYIAVDMWLVSWQIHSPIRIAELCFRHLHIFGDIDEHWPWTSRPSDMKSLPYSLSQVSHIGDQVIVLCDGHGDAGGVDLLKAIDTQSRRRDLSGDRYDRRRIHVRSGDPCDEVGSPRARGGHADAMGRPLLMAHGHVADGIVWQFMIDGHDRPARNAKDHLYALARQTFPNDLCSVQLHIRFPLVQRWLSGLQSHQALFVANLETQRRCWPR